MLVCRPADRRVAARLKTDLARSGRRASGLASAQPASDAECLLDALQRRLSAAQLGQEVGEVVDGAGVGWEEGIWPGSGRP
jgi:hypothetical protein